MLEINRSNEIFHVYNKRWISIYKEGAVRAVTMKKYYMTHKWLTILAPNLRLCDLSRVVYQQLINEYAETHERQTTMDFHHQVKCAILDAVEEGLIYRDPTRKAIIKGKMPKEKKPKYLNQYELHTLLSNLKLGKNVSWHWFILLIAKTGMRFSELIKDFPEDQPIFANLNKCIYNSTINGILYRLCKKSNLPNITIHGLRHTHASILLFAGVSIASVARRLGHASMTTTQKTYIHIIQELENQDVDLVMRSLSGLL